MDGDVTVRIGWSTINYKDGLAITGKAPVVRRFRSGEVEASSHPDWKPGDKVILNGWGTGETHLGAYAEKARVKGQWLVRLPASMSPREAMAIGTAGYTAMLAGGDPGIKRNRAPWRSGASGRLGRHCAPCQARFPGGRLDRAARGGRLPERPRCQRDRRPRRAFAEMIIRKWIGGNQQISSNLLLSMTKRSVTASHGVTQPPRLSGIDSRHVPSGVAQ